MWISLLCCIFVVPIISANLIFYQEGESATLECSGTGDVQFWFLHGKGMAITYGSQAPDADANMNENGTLYIENVSKKDHEGNHVCITKIDETLKAYSVNMNVKPLPPSDLWEARYRGMFITGLIAALVCLSLFAGFCLVHRFRYREPTTKVHHAHLVEEAYENPGLVDENDFSSKM